MTQHEFAQLKIGDVLYSKQANCKVAPIDIEIKVKCVWHDNEGNHCEETLPIADLSFIQKKKQSVAAD